MDIVVSVFVPVVVGVGVGILSGMLGIGGGTVMVPLFRLLFGMSPVMSTATSLFAIVPTSISGAVSHIRQKTCIPALGVALGIGGALTSPIGVWLGNISPGWLVMLAAAVVIVYSATNMIRKALKMKPAPKVQSAAAGSASSEAAAAAPAAAPAPVPAAEEEFHLSRKQLLLGVGIGFIAGFISGYVGVGGGFIMVPLMLSLIHIDMRKASGTSLIGVMILAIPGVIENAILGNINYLAGIAIVVGSIPGAVLGARLVKVIPERTLRFIFGGFLILAAILLVVNEVV